jgi:hypothetical protein
MQNPQKNERDQQKQRRGYENQPFDEKAVSWRRNFVHFNLNHKRKESCTLQLAQMINTFVNELICGRFGDVLGRVSVEIWFI